MGHKPQLCPHGILGKSKCKLCKKLRRKQWYNENIELEKNRAKKWRNEHLDEYSKYQKNYGVKWRENHKEKLKIHRQNYYQENKEELNNKSRNYNNNHKDERKKYDKNHREQARENAKKMKAKRRKLGWIAMNDKFEGSDAHHINNEDIVYCPHELHHSIWHSLSKNINMAVINNVIFEWLEQTNQVEWIIV